MNYIKQNHLSLLIILWLVVSAIFIGKPIIQTDIFSAINRPRTTITNPVTFEQGVVINSNADKSTNALTISGTTTQSGPSHDGFVASKNVTMATGTAKATYTATGNMMCRGGGVIFDATGATTLNPSLVFSLGTTTALLTYSANLIASTTVATDTDSMTTVTFTGTHYLVAGEKIQLGLSDYMQNASSTYYGNWDVEFGIPCWLLGSNY